MKKILPFSLIVIIAILIIPSTIFACEYNGTYSTTTLAILEQECYLSMVYDYGKIITNGILAILVILSALIGLGWGVRKFQKHVSGKKF